MIKIRLKALFWDYLFICLYLLGLLVLMMSYYLLILKGIPPYSQFQAQLVATFTTVVPLIIIFTIMECRKPFGSYGKRKAGLEIEYTGNPIIGSIIRNSLKFLPWELGHISAIRFAYDADNLTLSLVYFFLSIALVVLYISMVVVRKDYRHLPDILASSKVVKK